MSLFTNTSNEFPELFTDQEMRRFGKKKTNTKTLTDYRNLPLKDKYASAAALQLYNC